MAKLTGGLTPKDLQAIKEIVGEVVKPIVAEVVRPIIAEVVKPIVAEAVDEVAITTNNAIRKEVEMLREDMATKDDIKAIRAEMATKEDIAAIRAEMATKEDLKGFASKYDLQDAVLDIKDEIGSVLKNHEARLTTLEARVK